MILNDGIESTKALSMIDSLLSLEESMPVWCVCSCDLTKVTKGTWESANAKSSYSGFFSYLT